MKTRHQNLTIWKKSMQIAEEIYRNLESHKKDPALWALTDQIRRSSLSVPSNIAEGSYRSTKKEFIYFLKVAQGSCAEMQTQLTLLSQLSANTSYQDKDQEILVLMKQINAFISSLRKKNEPK